MRSIFYSLLCFVTLIPVAVYGQEKKIYSPLVDIPGNEAMSFEQYINFLYGASISIAALLAVVKIIIAGAKYMVSDLVSSKDSAKTDIQGAILGLLLILSAVIILEFINPQLVKRNIQFQELSKRPEVSTTSSVLAVVNEKSSAVMAGVNPCATPTKSPSKNGSKMLTTIDVSACGTLENKKLVLGVFETNCTTQGGQAYNNGVGSDKATCAIPIENGVAIAAANKAAQAELEYIKKTYPYQVPLEYRGTDYIISKEIPSEYIQLSENKVIVSIDKFCTDLYAASKSPSLPATQRAVAMSECSKDSGGSWSGRISGRCQTGGGKATVSSGSLTCAMPTAKIPVTQLEIIDPKVGPREPINWTEMKTACGKSNSLVKTNGLAPQTFDGLLGGLTPSDYTCIRY